MKEEYKEEEQRVINIWGSPMKIEQVLREKKSASWYCYKLVLFDLSRFPPTHYLLKMAIDVDISNARKIGYKLYQLELDWQQMQSDLFNDKIGIGLIFQPMGGEESLVVESSLEAFEKLTEEKREKEKSIFRELGKDYPERNISD